MPVVSLINRKGGVGKTTLTLALCDYLSSIYRKRILLIDLDPQANLSLGCVGEERWAELDRAKMTVADVFQQTIATNVPVAPTLVPVARIRGAVPPMLILSTPRVSDVEAEAMDAGEGWRRRLGSPYIVLAQSLGQSMDTYDYVLVDCPPGLGVITLNGLALSDGYIIPVMPTPVATTGIELLAAKIGEFSLGLRRRIKRYGTIINRIDYRTTLHKSIIKELEGNPEALPVWTTRIRATVHAEEGWDTQAPLTLIQRWGPLHSEFSSLAEEFIRRVI